MGGFIYSVMRHENKQQKQKQRLRTDGIMASRGMEARLAENSNPETTPAEKCRRLGLSEP